MKPIQKIACFIGGLAILYLSMTVHVGDLTEKLTVKYDDRLVEYVCKDLNESRDLIFKSNNGVLFFDGEYFYDEPPTHDRNKLRVNIIKQEQVVVNGDVHGGEFFMYICCILACVGLVCWMSSEHNREYDYEYDM